MNQEIIANLQKYVKALRKQNIPVDELYVFGSTARDQRHVWSDIDVAVVGKAFETDRIEEMMKLQSITCSIDPAISPIPMRPEDLQDRFDTIAQAVRSEGKKIAIEALGATKEEGVKKKETDIKII